MLPVEIRGARRMIRMGMVDPDNIQTRLASFTIRCQPVTRGNQIAVVRRIFPGVHHRPQFQRGFPDLIGHAEQEAATLMRISPSPVISNFLEEIG